MASNHLSFVRFVVPYEVVPTVTTGAGIVIISNSVMRAKELPPPRRAQKRSEKSLSGVAVTTSPLAITPFSEQSARSFLTFDGQTYRDTGNVGRRPTILPTEETDTTTGDETRDTHNTKTATDNALASVVEEVVNIAPMVSRTDMEGGTVR